MMTSVNESWISEFRNIEIGDGSPAHSLISSLEGAGLSVNHFYLFRLSSFLSQEGFIVI